jgi:hypothetical protein
MVVLLREVRVPARNVTGFIGGTYNRFGHYYAVRQGDAHSWVEAYVPERGWVTFDPTPPGEAAPKSEISGAFALVRDIVEAMGQRWDRYVVGYDLRQQVRLFDTLRHRSRRGPWKLMRSPTLWIGLLVLTTATVVAYQLYKRRRNLRSQDPVSKPLRPRQQIWATALYESLDAAMLAQGVPRASGTPPLMHARSLEQLGHPLAREILGVTHVYLESRFGGAELAEPQRRDVEVRVKWIRSVRREARAPSPAEQSPPA